MKTLILTILTTINIFFSLHGQTADQIINKHLEVTGGLTAWKTFNSVILNGEIVLGKEESYKIKILQQRPNLNKTTMYIQDREIILNGYNGKKAIKFNFTTNQIEEDLEYIPESFDSDLLEYNSKGFQAILIGTEKIGNSDCFKVKLIKNTNTITYFFDKNTYQLIRESNPQEIKTYSDFTKVSTLTFPMKTEVQIIGDNSNFTLVIDKVQVNPVISPKEFNF